MQMCLVYTHDLWFFPKSNPITLYCLALVVRKCHKNTYTDYWSSEFYLSDVIWRRIKHWRSTFILHRRPTTSFSFLFSIWYFFPGHISILPIVSRRLCDCLFRVFPCSQKQQVRPLYAMATVARPSFRRRMRLVLGGSCRRPFPALLYIVACSNGCH